MTATPPDSEPISTPQKPRWLPTFIWRDALRTVGAKEPEGGEVVDGAITGFVLDETLGIPGALMGILAFWRRRRRSRQPALGEDVSESRPRGE